MIVVQKAPYHKPTFILQTMRSGNEIRLDITILSIISRCAELPIQRIPVVEVTGKLKMMFRCNCLGIASNMVLELERRACLTVQSRHPVFSAFSFFHFALYMEYGVYSVRDCRNSGVSHFSQSLF